MALLKKYMEQYGTQQGVLEHALDNLGNNQKQIPELSPEEQFLLRAFEDKLTVNMEKGMFLMLMDAADVKKFESFFSRNKTYMAYSLEFNYQRPFKELNLKEVLDGLVLQAKVSSFFDRYNYSDDGDYYTLKIYHSLGMNGTKLSLIIIENVFDAFGAKYESTFSDKTIFVKIYKK